MHEVYEFPNYDSSCDKTFWRINTVNWNDAFRCYFYSLANKFFKDQYGHGEVT